MDKFIVELMNSMVEYDYYSEGLPSSVLSDLLQEYYGIKFDMANYHYRPTPKSSGQGNPLISQVWADAIVEQLNVPNSLLFMRDKSE